MILVENERIERLHTGDQIIQDAREFRFGVDAVLLADFCAVHKNDRIVDFCTGTGIVPILLSSKSRSCSVVGIEIMPRLASMATRSVELNCLEERVSIVNGDLKDSETLLEKNTFDAVTCNPPYFKANAGTHCSEDSVNAARHEIFCMLHDVVKNAASLLKSSGRFYMVHRPERLSEIILECNSSSLVVKRLRFVCPSADKAPSMVLVEARKGGDTAVKIEPNLYVYREKGVFTSEIDRIYGRI